MATAVSEDDIAGLLAIAPGHPSTAHSERPVTAPLLHTGHGPAPSVPVTALGPTPIPTHPAPAPPPTLVMEPAPAGRPAIERLLSALVRADGSDLNLESGCEPYFRIRGELLPVAGEPPLAPTDVDALLSAIVPEQAWHEFTTTGDLDAAYEMRAADGAALSSRFRLNYYTADGLHGAVIRTIPTTIPTFGDLGAPDVFRKLTSLNRGMVLLCGPTGSGKSSTAAAFIDELNERYRYRVITLEDPVEFRHTNKRSMITHREVGSDTPTFEEGLRRIRRQNPDVIYVGEMRDTETIRAGIEAADSGHLVLATLHANSAPETISRIVNIFPEGQQEQVRVTLSSCLRAVICQTLVPSRRAERGRALAAEVMVVTPAVASNIRENDIPSIANALLDTSSGSISLDASLVELVRSNQVTREDAEAKATSPEAFNRLYGANARKF